MVEVPWVFLSIQEFSPSLLESAENAAEPGKSRYAHRPARMGNRRRANREVQTVNWEGGGEGVVERRTADFYSLGFVWKERPPNLSSRTILIRILHIHIQETSPCHQTFMASHHTSWPPFACHGLIQVVWTKTSGNKTRRLRAFGFRDLVHKLRIRGKKGAQTVNEGGA